MNDVNFEFTPNLEKVIARLPDQWQHLFRRLGLKYSEATLPRIPVEKKQAVASYFAALKLLADVQHRRPKFIDPDPREKRGLDGMVEGLENRERAYGGIAELLDGIPGPDAFRSGHNILVKAVRDLRAVDRRLSRELRSFGDVSRFSEREQETRLAAEAINEALGVILQSSDCYFPPGVAADLLSEPP